jgi:hypothetical protein
MLAREQWYVSTGIVCKKIKLAKAIEVEGTVKC